MPTYEYICCGCGHREDKIEKMCPGGIKGVSCSVMYECPQCDDVMLRGPGGGIGVRFKGTGFYETDYKDKK